LGRGGGGFGYCAYKAPSLTLQKLEGKNVFKKRGTTITPRNLSEGVKKVSAPDLMRNVAHKKRKAITLRTKRKTGLGTLRARIKK